MPSDQCESEIWDEKHYYSKGKLFYSRHPTNRTWTDKMGTVCKKENEN